MARHVHCSVAMLMLALVLSASPEAFRVVEPPPRAERWGIVAVAEGTFSPDGVGGLVGAGLRIGFRERSAAPFAFMPAGALLFGAEISSRKTSSGWVETRVELMGARRGGLLQPAIHTYFSTGLRISEGYRAPLRGDDPPVTVRPYFGVGAGWNWLPDKMPDLNLGSGNPQGAAAVVLIGLLIAPLILMGRVELRVTPGLSAAQPAELAFVTGVGF